MLGQAGGGEQTALGSVSFLASLQKLPEGPFHLLYKNQVQGILGVGWGGWRYSRRVAWRTLLLEMQMGQHEWPALPNMDK